MMTHRFFFLKKKLSPNFSRNDKPFLSHPTANNNQGFWLTTTSTRGYWSSMAKYCQNEAQGNLVKILSFEENLAIYDVAVNQYKSSYTFWTSGVNPLKEESENVDNWYWLVGKDGNNGFENSTLIKMDGYTNWAENNPQNNRDYMYVQLDRAQNNGIWYSYSEKVSKYGICEYRC